MTKVSKKEIEEFDKCVDHAFKWLKKSLHSRIDNMKGSQSDQDRLLKTEYGLYIELVSTKIEEPSEDVRVGTIGFVYKWNDEENWQSVFLDQYELVSLYRDSCILGHRFPHFISDPYGEGITLLAVHTFNKYLNYINELISSGIQVNTKYSCTVIGLAFAVLEDVDEYKYFRGESKEFQKYYDLELPHELKSVQSKKSEYKSKIATFKIEYKGIAASTMEKAIDFLENTSHITRKKKAIQALEDLLSY